MTTKQQVDAEILKLAEIIVEVCREHTSSAVVAVASTEIAGKVIASVDLKESCEYLQSSDSKSVAA